ncbi:ABC transporter ATP-binding protein [Alicyclobacillus fructus]|uniref:ABC transporter ATP-binding protein n=1 Tax=Alicyclobacillus fructus TaxID=2816082 RepID=UPI001A8D9A85|nr:ABC transporter ATP-binding protein [Alicyclobacillus fructus]
MDIILSVNQLSKQIRGQTALACATFSVREGSVHGILGVNGSGKTTLLRIMAGLYRPDGGEIAWMDRPVIPWKEPAWRSQVAWVDPTVSLPARWALKEWETYGARMYERWDGHRFRNLLRGLDLPMDQGVHRFSLGMRMRAKLAFALATRPRLLLLDEPTTGLDPIVRRQVWQWLVGEAAESGAALLVATHAIDDVERLADSLTVLYRGRSVWSGQLDEAKERFVKLVVRPEGRAALDALEDVLGWERDGGGSFSAMVERDRLDDALGRLRAAGIHQVVIQERLPLDDWFRLLMQKEGCARDPGENA